MHNSIYFFSTKLFSTAEVRLLSIIIITSVIYNNFYKSVKVKVYEHVSKYFKYLFTDNICAFLYIFIFLK